MPCSPRVRAKDSDAQGVCVTRQVSGGVRRRHLHLRPPRRDLGAQFSTRPCMAGSGQGVKEIEKEGHVP